MREVIRIEFVRGTVEVPNVPLCNIGRLASAMRIVNENYPALAEPLRQKDPKHPWLRKVPHGLLMTERGDEILDGLGFQEDDPNRDLLQFVDWAHDLGRIPDAFRPVAKEYDGLQHHGQYSVRILEGWGIPDLFGPLSWPVMEYVIDHHADRTTPELAEGAAGLDIVRYAWTCLIRDSDKAAIFLDRTDAYLYDEADIKHQIEAMRRINPDFIGHAGYLSAPVVEGFMARTTIDRKLCYTYEDYMVMFLAWVFDFNYQPFAQSVDGAVKKLLVWLGWQLRGHMEQHEAVASTIRDYLGITV